MTSSRLFGYYRKSLALTQTKRRPRRNSGCIALRADVCNFPGNVWPREEEECCTPTLRFASECPKPFPSVPPLPSATNKELSMIYPSAKCRQWLSIDDGLPPISKLILTFLAKNTRAIVTAINRNDKAYFDSKTLKKVNQAYYVYLLANVSLIFLNLNKYN